MKNYKKFLLLLIGISITFLLYFAVQIYAKYVTSASGNAAMNIAHWNITINNLSIKNNKNFSTAIVPVFLPNEHIANDIIAPTSEGYFDLNFDFSNANVSFKYEINTQVDSKSPVKDLVATGYSIDDGEKIEFDNFNEPISDTIFLNDNIKNRKIRIYILWNDDENTQTMTNSEDAISTQSSTPALFKVDVSFIQIAE